MLVPAHVNLRYRESIRYHGDAEYATIIHYLKAIPGRVHVYHVPTDHTLMLADFHNEADRDKFNRWREFIDCDAA